MSNVTKLADLGDRSACTELLERIEQLEAQDGPGYGVCLEFYKRLAAEFKIREHAAFEGGWVARDSGGSFSEIDEWFETWTEAEAK